MLADSQQNSDETVYSEPFSHLPNFESESRQSSDQSSSSTPNRRSQNRSAIKYPNRQNKNAYPVETDNNSSSTSFNLVCDDGERSIVTLSFTKLVDEGVTSPSSSKGSLKGDGEKDEVSLRRKVSLGDYALPPDRMTQRLGGIPRSGSTEYTEPYETARMLQAIRNEERSDQLRKSSPAKLDGSEIYSLARNVPDQIRPASEIPDQGHHQNKSSDKTTNNNNVTGTYEEPWDTQKKLKEFTDICDKAESASNRRRSVGSPSQKSDTNMANVYEDAWDTANKQRELEMRVQDAHRRKSESACQKFDYEEPTERKFSLGQADLRSAGRRWTPAMKPPTIADVKEPVYSSNYESPWDNMQLEERLSRAGGLSPQSPTSKNSRGSRSSNSSDSSPGPPDFAPPPPPVPQAYEEAWDLRPQSKVISNSHDSSPGIKKLLQSPSIDHAVVDHFDPKEPLDLQNFYHGGISRKRAEELLVRYKIGSYLVRRSETQKNVFSLSLKGVGGIPMHLRIGLEHGEYILGENSQPFPTVPELIAYYTRHELPIQNANHIRLQFPIPKAHGMN